MNSDHHEELDLSTAILALKNDDECERFLTDLCTPQEIRALKERWRVCQLLDGGDLSYREIQQLSSASLVTITRVARFLKDESNNGYRTVLDRLKRKKVSCKKPNSLSLRRPQ
jgi:TrpR-related protein YerC/YecD